jgi:DNA-binding transcriptional MerR regulator/methylmalonyl-CoA mutase cobalamin-binding subunit
MKKITYPIRAVSKLTGIPVDNLRAWERRYQAIKPVRNDRERLYDDADVQRLILLRQAVDRGHAIGKLAVLSNPELEQINARSVALSTIPGAAARAYPQPTSAELKVLQDAIHRLDFGDIDRELYRLAAVAAPHDLVHHLVIPLMTDVGDRWYRGDLSIAQEHMVSAALRSLLGSLVRRCTTVRPATTFLFATTKGERHEFGILCAAMLAAAGGLRIAYLGIDIPGSEILEAAQRTNARVLVLGMKAATSSKDSLKELGRVSEKLPGSMELWVGGIHSANVLRDIKATRAIYLSDFDAFERELVRFGASRGAVGATTR